MTILLALFLTVPLAAWLSRTSRSARARLAARTPTAMPWPRTVATRLGFNREKPANEVAWREVSGLSKSEAEDLLDWLESNGYDERRVDESLPRGFTVGYRPPERETASVYALSWSGRLDAEEGRI